MNENPPPFVPTMASRRHRLPALLALLLLPCVATVARADDPGPSAAQKETARGLMDLGDTKLAAGDHAGALHAYQGADAIMGVPTTGVAVARAQVRLGKLVEAADALGKVRRYPERPNEPQAFVLARREAHELYADLSARIPVVRVTVRGVAPGAEVALFIDGAKLTGPSVDQPHRLNPGRHVIEAKAEGYHSDDDTITLAEGQHAALELALVADPNAKPADTTEPPANDELTLSPLTYSAFAVGGAGALLGTITGIVSLAMTTDLEEQCHDRVCAPELASDHDTIITLANVSNVALALGAVGAGVGVVSLIFDLDEGGDDRSAQLSLEPLLGAGFFGLRGTF